MIQQSVCHELTRFVARPQHARAMLATSIMTTRKKRERRTIGKGGKFMVHPLSEFHQMWDVFMTFLISTTVITVPLALGWTNVRRPARAAGWQHS